MSVIHAPTRPQFDLRHGALLIVLGIAILIIFFRLWYLQVMQADALTAKAEVFRTSSVDKLAPRGLIFDREGKLLAGVQPELVLTAVPAVVYKKPVVVQRIFSRFGLTLPKTQPIVLHKISKLIGVPFKKLEAKVASGNWRPYLPTPIAIDVPIEAASRVAESPDEFPGIGVESQPMRVQTDTVTMSHIMGYVWTPSKGDVDRLEAEKVKPAEYVGKLGIEYVYEKQLMGKAGSEQLEIDAKRRPLRIVGRNNPTPGDRLVLSVSKDLQRYALSLLKGRTGAIVAIEPKTGEILCLASSPSYDAAVFRGGIQPDEWNALQNNPTKPMLNRAISSRYSPGSTFKIVTTLAGVSAGVWSPGKTAFCDGFYKVGNRKLKCLGRHGYVSFHQAMTKSCNAYFADLGIHAGAEALKQTALDLGLGNKTGIDLRSESKGLVPTDEWLEAQKPPRKWYPGDTVNMSIGQGETAATPLQMANVIALVANDGKSFVPHLVRKIIPSDKKLPPIPIQPTVAHSIDAPPSFWHALKGALGSVIENGTAKAAQISGMRWGGKTGSTEHRRGRETHSWFVGFAPLNAPKIAIAVLVEDAGHGGEVAAPIAKQVVEHYLKLSKAPTADRNSESRASTSSESALRPN